MGGSSGQRRKVSDCLSRPAVERGLLDDQLDRIEQASQSVLKALNYPTTLDALASRSWPPSEQLPVEQRKPYRRAFRATQALLYVDQTRRFLDEGNIARAAYAAMQAGVFGGDLLSDAERGAKIQQSVRKGGRAKARQRRQALIDRDREWVLARYFLGWKNLGLYPPRRACYIPRPRRNFRLKPSDSQPPNPPPKEFFHGLRCQQSHPPR